MVIIELTGYRWVQRCAGVVAQRSPFALHIPSGWRARRALRWLGYETPRKIPLLLSYSIPLIAGSLAAAIDAGYRFTPEQQRDGSLVIRAEPT